MQKKNKSDVEQEGLYAKCGNQSEKTMGKNLEYRGITRSALHTTSHRELRNHGEFVGHVLQRKN